MPLNPLVWALAGPTNPQSLDWYSHALNNSLSFTDPDSLGCVWDDGSFDSAEDKQTDRHSGCSSQNGTYVDPKAFSALIFYSPATKGDLPNQSHGTRPIHCCPNSDLQRAQPYECVCDMARRF